MKDRFVLLPPCVRGVLVAVTLIFAAEAGAVPIDVTYQLSAQFHYLGHPVDPYYQFGGGTLVVRWTGTPEGEITGPSGQVSYLRIGQELRSSFGGEFSFSGPINLLGGPTMVAMMHPSLPRLTLAGTSFVSGAIRCNGSSGSCAYLGLISGINAFSQYAAAPLVMDFWFTPSNSPSMPLGVMVGFEGLRLSLSGEEILREVVPEPTSRALIALGLVSIMAARAGWQRRRY